MTKRLMKQAELEANEIRERRSLEGYVAAFLDFPDAHNLQLVMERLNSFQTAWVHRAAMTKAR